MENLIEWPLSEADLSKPKVLLSRLQDWKKSIDLLTVVLRDVAAAETISGRAMAKISKLLEEDTSELGLVSEPVAALKTFVDRAAENHLATAKMLEEQSLRRLVEVRQTLSVESKRFKRVMESQLIPLQRERAATIIAINAHTRTYQKAASGTVSSGDPWLSEVRLKHRLIREIDEENAFKHAMAGLYHDIKALNSSAAQTSIGALIDLATSKRVQILDTKECVDEVIRQGMAVATPLQKPGHVHPNDAKDEEKYLEPSRADEVEYPFRYADLSQIVKVGILKLLKSSALPPRAGPASGELWDIPPPELPPMTSGLWRTFYVALSECGFLHCFMPDDPTLSDPIMSINLREADLSLNQNDDFNNKDDDDSQLCFSVSFMTNASGFFPQRDMYLMRALSAVDLVEWMAALHLYMRKPSGTSSGTTTPRSVSKPQKKIIPTLSSEDQTNSDGSLDGNAQSAMTAFKDNSSQKTKSRAASAVTEAPTLRLRSFSWPSACQFIKQGYLHKLTLDAQQKRVWTKRFFVARLNSISYYENERKARKDQHRRDIPLDGLFCTSAVIAAAQPSFVVELQRSRDPKAKESASLPPPPPTSFCFRLSTPQGVYLLCAATLVERQSWIETAQAIASVAARIKVKGVAKQIPVIPDFKRR